MGKSCIYNFPLLSIDVFKCEILYTRVQFYIQEYITVSVEKIDFPASHLWDSITSSCINISGIHFRQNTFLSATDVDME